MLSMEKFLSRTQRYSLSRSKLPTITCHALGSITIIERKFSIRVPERLLIDEEDREKYKIDSRLKVLSRKLLYCDSIEKKLLRGDPKKTQVTFRRMRYKAKMAKEKSLMEDPAVSVALKYLRTDKNNGEEKDSEAREEHWETVEKEEKNPIYMPYSSTDSYKTITSSPKKEETKMAELNEEYISLYEKYLETTKSSTSDDLEKLLRDKDSSVRVTRRRRGNESQPIPPNWMTDYEQYNEDPKEGAEQSFYGTPDTDIPVSSVPCGGCGALLHCQDPAIPGYLPSELFKNQTNDVLRSTTCQRCHFMKVYKTTLNVTVSPDEYPKLLQHIRSQKAAVIMMVDLTDFPCSIWPGIKEIINKNTPLFVIGNKVDLLPSDGPGYLKKIEESLRKSIKDSGIDNVNIKHVALISAKTGYGVEELINKLHKIWEYKGDVYLIGCTNVGKSSLFNALLQSDYCKIQAADLIQRATISPWPGTTLNLLKFPILNPVRKRLWERTQRLIDERESVMKEREDRKEKFKETRHIKFTTLQGHIGKSFKSSQQIEGEGYFGTMVPGAVNTTGLLGYNEQAEIYKYSRWCFDTPGAILPDQILHFLTTEELMLTLPRRIISPRTFLLHGAETLFLAGLGRLDCAPSTRYIRCTIFSSYKLPVTICKSKFADDLYKKLLQTEALLVPKNDPERLKIFPDLGSKVFEMVGIGWMESVADVVLSNAGWIAVTAGVGAKIKIRAWTPDGKGIHLRTPAMLSRSVGLKGHRIPNSPLFTKGQQVYIKK